MNFLSLISSWLDINCQITTEYAIQSTKIQIFSRTKHSLIHQLACIFSTSECPSVVDGRGQLDGTAVEAEHTRVRPSAAAWCVGATIHELALSCETRNACGVAAYWPYAHMWACGVLPVQMAPLLRVLWILRSAVCITDLFFLFNFFVRYRKFVQVSLVILEEGLCCKLAWITLVCTKVILGQC